MFHCQFSAQKNIKNEQFIVICVDINKLANIKNEKIIHSNIYTSIF